LFVSLYCKHEQTKNVFIVYEKVYDVGFDHIFHQSIISSDTKNYFKKNVCQIFYFLGNKHSLKSYAFSEKLSLNAANTRAARDVPGQSWEARPVDHPFS